MRGDEEYETSTALGVARYDGRWQIGVGPGSVVVGEPVLPDSWAGLFATAFVAAGGRGSRPGGAGAAGPGSVEVRGSGPLAARLRRGLDRDEDGPCVLTVLVHEHAIPPGVGVDLARRGVSVLPVVEQERRVVVGPFAAARGTPCLHCLDLTRRDLDPSWPEVAALLGEGLERRLPARPRAGLHLAAEGLVHMLVDSILSGVTPAPGLAHELGPDPPHVVQRRWVRHPACRMHTEPDLPG